MIRPGTSEPATKPRSPKEARVLLVEDEAFVRESLGSVLTERGYEVTFADDVPNALDLLRRQPLDLVLTDLKMPNGGGLELVRRARAAGIGTPIIVLTGFGTIASAVECLKAGASDYILKPAGPDVLEVAFDRLLSKAALELEVGYLRDPSGSGIEAVGESPAWLRALAMVKAAAVSDSTILLLGESGTGKEVLARLAHAQSRRAEGPFVEVNCAAVPLSLWESEFFGYRRGAFTGAQADRPGRFRIAHGGTLFVDEIAATPLEGQAKLLRAIERGEFFRLGDERPTRANVRIIAATNGDLRGDIVAGRFRDDLYHRLNVLRIDVPPLRDRVEDIPLLTRHFVREIAGRLGRTPPEVPEATLAEMRAYHWPGNVRELRGVLERALTLDPQNGLADLDLAPIRPDPRTEDASGAASEELTLRAALGRTERERVVSSLRRSGGVRKEAARTLGIDQRNLAYYLHKHGIDPDDPK